MDSLLISNGATVNVPSSGSVTIYVLDQGTSTNPINLNGGTVANSGGNPNDFTLVYNGTKPLNLGHGAAMFGTIYAPNSGTPSNPVTISGNAGIYGAVVVAAAAFSGSGHITYDTNLKNETPNVNQSSTIPAVQLDQFSWSKN